MPTAQTKSEITDAVGDELGVGNWVTTTQDQVNMFAEATGDHQWIHTDVERANQESPFGGPIAHGYLSLALLPMLGWQIYAIRSATAGINHGSNKVRFPAPVAVGARVRLRSTLRSAEPLPTGPLQIVMEQVLEIKNEPKPAIVAETIGRVAF